MEDLLGELLSQILPLDELVTVDEEEGLMELDHLLGAWVGEQLIDLPWEIEVAAGGVLLVESSGHEWGEAGGREAEHTAGSHGFHSNQLTLIPIIIRC